MKLYELLADVAVREIHADPDTEITQIAYDSRRAAEGTLFAAVSGFTADGNRFIPMAMEKGARAVITAKKPEIDVPYVLVDNDRLALAQVSANFYHRPAEQMTLIGVTGTNGKTSVTLLLKHVIEQVTGEKVGLIGTMYNMVGEEKIETGRTTPESLELQALFARMRDGGCRYAVMEVSSHALSLERVGGVRFDAAAFTNLTEDHLDFHKTMEAYCDAKALLFSRCKVGVLNRDDPWFERMTANASCRIFTTSRKDENADLYAENAQLHADGVSFTACFGDRKVPVHLAIPGGFTVFNAMTVLGLAVNLGIDPEDAARALSTASGVKGRVEVVPVPGKPYTVLIDYAHTPDGLENVLSSVRGFCKGRLIAVFGCGGDRDPIKRPIMGRIGASLADIAVITSDNPRTEDPEAIIRDILEGIEDRTNVKVIADRRTAIDWALKNAKKDDIIVLAGKGHETYQEICGVKYPMDERQIVAECLKEG